jgi:galactitol-specific phosphotransferase system IIB component
MTLELPFNFDTVGNVIPIEDLQLSLETIVTYVNDLGTSIGATGPTGATGSVGPIGPSQFTTVSSDFQIVDNVLELYRAIAINHFYNSVNTVEIGTTITSVDLIWSSNKTPTTISLTGDGTTSLLLTATGQNITGLSLTSTATWNLTMSDGINEASAYTTVNFEPLAYWGVSSLTALDNAEVLALASSDFSYGTSLSNVVYDCTGGAYPYYVYPASFGLLSNVTVGGLSFSDYETTVLSLTNTQGFTQSYNVVRFNGLQTGNSLRVNWS